MLISSWNVNSVRARIDNIKSYLVKYKPDILLMQEIKTEEVNFPFDVFSSLDYESHVHGQKSYNGVAIISKKKLDNVKSGHGCWRREWTVVKADVMTQCDARLPQAGVKLADYTTWRVGGAAEWLAEPASLEETQAWIEWAAHQGMPCRVIGAGSNLLIHDDGLPGLSLCLRKLQGLQLDATTGTVEVLAGEPIPSLARRAARAGLHGLEWSVGIPGTAGGAAVMNAGAQGG